MTTPSSRPTVRSARTAGRFARSALGYASLLVGVLVLAGGAVIQPIAVAALLLGIGILALTWTRPKTALAVTFVATLLSPQLQAAAGAAGGILDEALIFGTLSIITVKRLLVERSLVWLPGFAWFLLFGFVGVLGALLYGTPIAITLQGAILLLKCVAFAFTLAQVHWSGEDLHRLARAGMVLAIALIVTGLINLAIPSTWNAVFAGSRGEFYGGIPAIIGPFRQPAAFGRLAVILAASILVYQLFVRSSWWGWVVATVLGGMALLTFRVKALVGLGVVTAGIVLRSGRMLLIVPALALVGALLAIVGPSLFVYVFGDLTLYYGQVSARSRLTAGGLEIAQTYFPLGVGFGRYGSATAADYYSPEYTRLGFESVYGLGSGDAAGAFLNDTQWPALLGETGWLGTTAFVVGSLLAVRVLLFRTSSDELPIVRWLRFSGVAWFVLVMLDSVAAPVFTSPPSYLFLFAAPAIVASIRSDLRTGHHRGALPLDRRPAARDSADRSGIRPTREASS